MILVFIRDITERKRAEEALVQSHRQLEQLNRAKTRAVNHISHELKTPLAVIRGNVRLLHRRLRAMRPGESFTAILEAMERNLDRLSLMQKQATRY